MKKQLQRLCWPILCFFEKNDAHYCYKKSHRITLVILGLLFLLLSALSLLAALQAMQLGALMPIIVFCAAGIVSLVVGGLGSDGAVARIWGSK